MKITDYNEITELSADNVLLIDGGETGTAKMKAENAGYALVDMTNINNRRQIFRGKYLGDTITAEHRDNIENGTFKDLWLGDYWTIGGHNWRIVDFDYWYAPTSGYNGTIQKHHLVIMPDDTITRTIDSRMLFTSSMQMYKHLLAPYTDTSYNEKANGSSFNASSYEVWRWTISVLKDIFGEDVVNNYFLTRQSYSTTAITFGTSNASSSYNKATTTTSSKSALNVRVDIPTEFMIFGTRCAAPCNSGSYGNALSMAEYGYKQFALFNVAPIFIQGNYVLKDMPKTNTVSYVQGMTINQKTNNGSEVDNLYVRPVFAYGR